MKRKVKLKNIKTYAKCGAFDLSIDRVIYNRRDLSKEEIRLVERKFKQRITTAIASLPFSEIYPYEVRIR